MDGPVAETDTDATAASADGVDLGWAAGSPAGRALVSVLVGFLVFMLVIWNLPASEVRGEIRPALRPITRTLAIDQDWGVFAPNPTRQSVAVEADITLADGTVEHYTFPHGDDFIGAYREYRWRKWERRVRLDDNRRMWEPTAEWVAARYADRDPVSVTLIRYWSETPEPGSGDPRVWNSFSFYTLDLTEDGDR